jgi:hypothetical protein
MSSCLIARDCVQAQLTRAQQFHLRRKKEMNSEFQCALFASSYPNYVTASLISNGPESISFAGKLLMYKFLLSCSNKSECD